MKITKFKVSDDSKFEPLIKRVEVSVPSFHVPFSMGPRHGMVWLRPRLGWQGYWKLEPAEVPVFQTRTNAWNFVELSERSQGQGGCKRKIDQKLVQIYQSHSLLTCADRLRNIYYNSFSRRLLFLLLLLLFTFLLTIKIYKQNKNQLLYLGILLKHCVVHVRRGVCFGVSLPQEGKGNNESYGSG